MQISTNTTGMLLVLTVFTDKDGRVHCVVVVKGTFTFHQDGTVASAEEQQTLIYTYKHIGNPRTTSNQYGCDIAPSTPSKTRINAIVSNFAFSLNGSPVREMLDGFQLRSFKKIIKLFGDRIWHSGLTGLRPSDPKPFIKIPLRNVRGGSLRLSS